MGVGGGAGTHFIQYPREICKSKIKLLISSELLHSRKNMCNILTLKTLPVIQQEGPMLILKTGKEPFLF